MSNKYSITCKTYNPELIPKFEEGQKAVILMDASFVGKRLKDKTFRGKVISVNSHHVTLRDTAGVKNSFNYRDFLTGDLKLL